MFDQEDEGTRIGVFVALGVVFMVVVGVIGGLVLRQANDRKATPATALAAAPAAAPAAALALPSAAPAAAAEVLIDGPATGTTVGALFFAVGAAALPEDAKAQVEAALKALADNPGKKLVLSGYHDASGDPAKNAELAKQRAFAVRDALQAAGADATRVGLRKPESTTGGGDPKEARRVEIRLVD